MNSLTQDTVGPSVTGPVRRGHRFCPLHERQGRPGSRKRCRQDGAGGRSLAGDGIRARHERVAAQAARFGVGWHGARSVAVGLRRAAGLPARPSSLYGRDVGSPTGLRPAGGNPLEHGDEAFEDTTLAVGEEGMAAVSPRWANSSTIIPTKFNCRFAWSTRCGNGRRVSLEVEVRN